MSNHISAEISKPTENLMKYTKTEEQRFAQFVKKLTALSRKYGIGIQSIGGVNIYAFTDETKQLTYRSDHTSGDLEFNL